MESYAHLTVGFVLSLKDLWHEQTLLEVVCPNRHQLSTEGDFCPVCGHRCVKSIQKLPTEGFSRFCEKYSTSEADRAFELLVDAGASGILMCAGLHNVREVSCNCDRDPDILVFGFRLATAYKIGEHVCATSLDQLREVSVTLGEMRHCLGVEDRPIRIYTHLYLSV